MWLYTPLCPSVCPSVGWLVGWLVGWSVPFFTFWRFWAFWAHCSWPNAQVTFSVTAQKYSPINDNSNERNLNCSWSVCFEIFWLVQSGSTLSTDYSWKIYKLLLKQFGHKTFLSKIIAKFEQILIRIYIICAPQIMNKWRGVTISLRTGGQGHPTPIHTPTSSTPPPDKKIHKKYPKRSFFHGRTKPHIELRVRN